METGEAATSSVEGGPVQSLQDLSRRVQSLMDGDTGREKEVLEVTGSLAERVTEGPIPSIVLGAVHHMTNVLCQNGTAIKGILIVKKLITRACTPGILSSLHSDLLQLCLAAKLPSPALPFLDTHITDITTTEDIDVQHILQYFYYGGCIYSSLSNFPRALHFFEMCLSVPAQQTSVIQVAAYQKAVLVTLILGRCKPNHLILSRPYFSLFGAEGNAEKLVASIAQMTPTLEKHDNLGLAKQALESVREREIAKFHDTFVSLKLSSLASHLKLTVTEIEKRIGKMINNSQFPAQICKKEGVLWMETETQDPEESLEQVKAALVTSMNSFNKAKVGLPV
eukprot:sb/3466495/